MPVHGYESYRHTIKSVQGNYPSFWAICVLKEKNLLHHYLTTLLTPAIKIRAQSNPAILEQDFGASMRNPSDVLGAKELGNGPMAKNHPLDLMMR